MSIELVFETVIKQKWRCKTDIVFNAICIGLQELLSEREEIGHGTFHISLSLTDDREIQTINSQYRGKDKPTNVLSFQNIDWSQPFDNYFGFAIEELANRNRCYSITENSVKKIKYSDVNKSRSIIPLGDIIISYERIYEEAKDEGKSFDEHLAFISVHGLLHLMGYDHEFEDDALEMARLEQRIMGSYEINCTKH